MTRDWTLDIESRVVQLEQMIKERDVWAKGLAKRVTNLEIEAGVTQGRENDYQKKIEKYRQETLAVEKRYETLLEAMQKIAKVIPTAPITDAEVEMFGIAYDALEQVGVRKLDGMPLDASEVEEPDSYEKRLRFIEKEYKVYYAKYEIARKALKDISDEYHIICGQGISNITSLSSRICEIAEKALDAIEPKVPHGGIVGLSTRKTLRPDSW